MALPWVQEAFLSAKAVPGLMTAVLDLCLEARCYGYGRLLT